MSFALLLFALLSASTICSVSVWAGYCNKQAHNDLYPGLGDHDHESPRRGHRRNVELPEDCGRFNGLFSGQPLRSLSYPRIRSGYDAKVGQIPSFVELQTITDDGRIFTCGGTILTTRHILSAVHCVDGRRAEYAKVGFGLGSYMKNKVKDFEIGAERFCTSSKFHINEGAADNTEPLATYDVAIIKLNKDIRFNDRVQPACLPRPGHPLGNHQQAFSIGMGFMYNNPVTKEARAPSTLQVLPNTRVQCSESDRHESIICHKANNPDFLGIICSGDSGGPFMALNLDERQTVYGIHSYASVLCGDWTPDLGEYVSEFDFNTGKSADVHNLREEIDKLLEECA